MRRHRSQLGRVLCPCQLLIKLPIGKEIGAICGGEQPKNPLRRLGEGPAMYSRLTEQWDLNAKSQMWPNSRAACAK